MKLVGIGSPVRMHWLINSNLRGWLLQISNSDSDSWTHLQIK